MASPRRGRPTTSRGACSIPSKYESVLLAPKTDREGFGCRTRRFRRAGNKLPGPGSYDVPKTRAVASKFSSSSRYDPPAPQSPGPGSYTPGRKQRDFRATKTTRAFATMSSKSLLSPEERNPGPGSYDLAAPPQRASSRKKHPHKGLCCAPRPSLAASRLGLPAPGTYDPSPAAGGRLLAKSQGIAFNSTRRSSLQTTVKIRPRKQKQVFFPALALQRELGKNALQPDIDLIKQPKFEYPYFFDDANDWRPTPGPAEYDVTEKSKNQRSSSMFSSSSQDRFGHVPPSPKNAPTTTKNKPPSSPGPGAYLSVYRDESTDTIRRRRPRSGTTVYGPPHLKKKKKKQRATTSGFVSTSRRTSFTGPESPGPGSYFESTQSNNRRFHVNPRRRFI